jgi:hypothetical protein
MDDDHCDFCSSLKSEMNTFLEIKIPGRSVTNQTARDHIQTRKRVAEVAPLFVSMKVLFAGRTKHELLTMSMNIANAKQIPHVDRLARRSRDVLICWFCRCAPELLISHWLDPGHVPVELVPEEKVAKAPRIEFPELPEEVLSHIYEDSNSSIDVRPSEKAW